MAVQQDDASDEPRDEATGESTHKARGSRLIVKDVGRAVSAMQVTLREDEVDAVALALQHLMIRDRTGELGVLHGADRFVSTHVILKRSEREALDRAAQKIGLGQGVARFQG